MADMVVAGPHGQPVVIEMEAAARRYRVVLAEIIGRGVVLTDEQTAELIVEACRAEAGHLDVLEAMAALL